MKHVPNILSISRILLSIGLFFSVDNGTLFIIIYLICGISDAVDGYIARKNGTTSQFGARLDSIGDLVMFGVFIVFMFISEIM
jgi:Phosphatidylglycerophosphate synthase